MEDETKKRKKYNTKPKAKKKKTEKKKKPRTQGLTTRQKQILRYITKVIEKKRICTISKRNRKSSRVKFNGNGTLILKATRSYEIY